MIAHAHKLIVNEVAGAIDRRVNMTKLGAYLW